jgi:DNA-binding transcriptional MerR regulator
MKALTIGQLARRTAVNIETVRYYERRGLLPEPRRRPSGYRQYSTDDVDRLRAIRQAQRLGFTLREILELLPLFNESRPRCRALLRHAQRKIDELAEKIRELQAAKAALEGLVGRCDAQPGANRACRATIEWTVGTRRQTEDF